MNALVISSIEPSFLHSLFLMLLPSLCRGSATYLKVVLLETMDVSHLIQEIQENLRCLVTRQMPWQQDFAAAVTTLLFLKVTSPMMMMIFLQRERVSGIVFQVCRVGHRMVLGTLARGSSKEVLKAMSLVLNLLSPKTLLPMGHFK